MKPQTISLVTAPTHVIVFTWHNYIYMTQLYFTGWTVRGSNPGRGRDFLHLSRPALRPTQSPVQWVPGLSRGVKRGRGVTLTPHPLLVPRSKTSRAIPLLSLRSLWPMKGWNLLTNIFTWHNYIYIIHNYIYMIHHYIYMTQLYSHDT
jgi:hypothetical protein